MCSACNRQHNRDRRPYERYMRKTYGPAVLAELDRLRAALDKVTEEELRETFGRYGRWPDAGRAMPAH
jgi:hypothetical protein